MPMMNPTLLSSAQADCPKECPFLSERGFLPGFLPYYCDKYEQFLGADPKKKTLRCAPCRRQLVNIVQTGLSYIEAYTSPMISIEETKAAFLEINKAFQSMFVEVIKKTGQEIAIRWGDPATPAFLSDEILKAWQEAQELAGSQELKDFKAALSSVECSACSGLLTKQTQNLLSNLFQVLDKSEREILKHALNNTEKVDAFMEHFHKLPHDNSLLKNFRALLYEYEGSEKVFEHQQQMQQMMLLHNRQKIVENSR